MTRSDPLPRALLPTVLEDLETFRVVCITGARQAGKTTLAREIAQRRKGTVISLDGEETLTAIARDRREFLDRPGLTVVDEFQRGGDALLRTIKLLVDESPRRGRFLLTGSTRFLTVPTLSESLAGRVGLVDLWPLSQGERRGRADRFVERVFGKTAALRSAGGESLSRSDYLEALCAGGFPDLIGDRPSARANWYRSYVRTIVQRDVPEIADVRRGPVLDRLVRLLAARTAREINVASLASALSVSPATVESYLSLLETVYVSFRLPSWSRNLTKKIVRHAKSHMVDSGLAAHLLNIGPGALALPGAPALGPLLETFVAGELSKQAGWASGSSVALHHFRDRDGLEVDFVLEAGDGRVALLEVKAGASLDSKDARGIERLRERIGPAFANGVILYLGRETLPLGPGLTALPVSALWTP